MISTAGYSGTPLAKKLGLKDGQAIALAGLPESLDWLLRERAFSSVGKHATWKEIAGEAFDYIHLFTDKSAIVGAALPALRQMIRADGMIWISWPKKASKVPTDVTEDVVRAVALDDVLVDVKVCAVDDVWSGLKLVIRKEYRP